MANYNDFVVRLAKQVIDRKSELEGQKGLLCIDIAKKIVANTANQRDLNEFNSLRDFIVLSFL